MATLVVLTGKHKGKKIALPDKEVIFGRDEGCFIRLASTDVSRKHCALIPTPRGILVRDLGSQNGTIVNNAIIEQETLLQPGDFVQIGAVQFQLEGPPPPKSKELDIDIAEWLSESDTSTDIPNASDTTILKSADWHPVPKAQPQADADAASGSEAGIEVESTGRAAGRSKPDSTPEFATIADEARDIIRRHLESLDR